jgi:hypothetical protein
MHFYMHSYLHKNFILVKSGCYRAHGSVDHARLRLKVDCGKGEAVGLPECELASAVRLGSSPRWHEQVKQVKAVLTKAKIS